MLIKNKKIELYSNTLPHNVLYCFLKYKSHLSGFRWALIFGQCAYQHANNQETPSKKKERRPRRRLKKWVVGAKRQKASLR